MDSSSTFNLSNTSSSSSSSASSSSSTSSAASATSKLKENKKRSLTGKQTKTEARKKHEIDKEAIGKELRAIFESGKDNGARRRKVGSEYLVKLQQAGMITNKFAQQIEQRLDEMKQSKAIKSRAMLEMLEQQSGLRLLSDEGKLQAESSARTPVADFPYEDSEEEEEEKEIAISETLLAMIDVMSGGNQDLMRQFLNRLAYEHGIQL